MTVGWIGFLSSSRHYGVTLGPGAALCLGISEHRSRQHRDVGVIAALPVTHGHDGVLPTSVPVDQGVTLLVAVKNRTKSSLRPEQNL